MTHPLQPAVTRFCLLRAGCVGDLLKDSFTRNVASAFAHRMSPAELNRAYEEARRILLEDGLVTLRPKARKALILTEAGRKAAADSLALPSWPEMATWPKLVVPRLAAFALGRLDADGLAETAKADGLRKEILRIRLGEVVKTKRPNPAAILRTAAAVGAIQSGFEAVRAALLKRAAEIIAFGAASWPASAEQPVQASLPQPREPLTLEAFAEAVKQIAKETPTGRIGRSLVFINHVWQHATKKYPEWQLDLEAFKARLREAALEGHITLMVSNTFEDHLKSDMLASRIDDGLRRWELVNLSPERVVF